VRGLVLDGPGRIRLAEDLPDPRIVEDTDAIVAVTAAGLCGSDLHPYEGRERVRPGVVQGHEIVGKVVAAGPAVTRFGAGRRVLAAFTTSCGGCGFCTHGLTSRCVQGALFGYGHPDKPRSEALDGGQADLVRVPLADTTLMAVPDTIGDVDAVLLTDNLPTAWHAARNADITAGTAVAVVGLGSVGLLTVQAAFAQGAGTVVAVDLVADRRDRAAALGATACSPDDIADAAGTFDAVIEAAGSQAAQGLAFTLLRPGATLSIIAVQTDRSFAFTPVEAYDANLTLRAGRAPVRAVLDELLPLITADTLRIPTDTVVTHAAVPLEAGPQLYRRFAAREPGLVKAVFAPAG
jgi:alcohol dehydrogenase